MFDYNIVGVLHKLNRRFFSYLLNYSLSRWIPPLLWHVQHGSADI